MGVNIPSVDVEISKLSGGQRQGIAVARSVYANAKVLLLDEPLAAMGVKESAMILDVIQRLKEKGEVSIIIVAHNYAQIFDFCDRINLLQSGQISFDRRTAGYLCRRVDQPRRARVSCRAGAWHCGRLRKRATAPLQERTTNAKSLLPLL